MEYEKELEMEVTEAIPTKSAPSTALVLTICCGILVVLVSLYWRLIQSRRNRPVLLMMGPPCSGKTSLCLKLVGQDCMDPMPSIVPNINLTQVGTRKKVNVKIIDIPGHCALTYDIGKYLKHASVIVIVIDAVEILRELHEAAECIWRVIEHGYFKRYPVPILIAANKYDMGEKCQKENVIRIFLQRELAVIKKQHYASDVSVFTFDQVKSKVAIGQISVKSGELGAFHDFVFQQLSKTKVKTF